MRKLARDLGVALDQVEGTGRDGLIVRSDVTRAADQSGEVSGTAEEPLSDVGQGLQSPSSSESSPSASSAAEDARPSGGDAVREERIPIAGMRKHIAAAMVASAFTAPHATVFLTVDVSESMELLARLRGQKAYEGVKLTPLTLAAKAVCLALARHPALNSRWDEGAREIVQYRYVNLGIAAATPREIGRAHV